MSQQDQFLDVIDRDLAEQRFQTALHPKPLGKIEVTIHQALGHVLADDVVAPVDVPSFDRSNYDGFAVHATDTYRATEDAPRSIKLLDEKISAGSVPTVMLPPARAVSVATGGMLPRGADAVVMIEQTDVTVDQNSAHWLLVNRAVTPGFGITFAGTDIGAGETVLRRGELVTSRETGVLAAIGKAHLTVWRPVAVTIISTGDEIISPRETMKPGKVYDSNAQILADAIRELGAEPRYGGIVSDDLDALQATLDQAIKSSDVVLLSGGTSKGEGDLCYRVVSELQDPGIVAHGIALKPGKPLCLAVSQGKAVVVLPGFPTSAIFTFHEFVAPVICQLGGRPRLKKPTVTATLATKVNSEVGRTEYLLVNLVERPHGSGRLTAFPMGKGSGSVTTFSRADGFVTIDRHDEILETGSHVGVRLLAPHLVPADLVVVGSHCMGLDYLLGKLHERGFRTKFLAVGSTAGLAAAQRGECDLAGIHLLDRASGQYNRPFLTPNLEFFPGYSRRQGIAYRTGDTRFEGQKADTVVTNNQDNRACAMINRNHGSGTRILIDQLLQGFEPNGYSVQVKNHHAVATAIVQQRADWGVTIEPIARQYHLGFLPLQQERFDFVVPKPLVEHPSVVAFSQLLNDPAIKDELCELGFTP